MQSSAICNGEQGRGSGVEDGCDFTLIVLVHTSVYLCVSVNVDVCPRGIGGVRGICENDADFTGAAGLVCTHVSEHWLCVVGLGEKWGVYTHGCW